MILTVGMRGSSQDKKDRRVLRTLASCSCRLNVQLIELEKIVAHLISNDSHTCINECRQRRFNQFGVGFKELPQTKQGIYPGRSNIVPFEYDLEQTFASVGTIVLDMGNQVLKCESSPSGWRPVVLLKRDALRW